MDFIGQNLGRIFLALLGIGAVVAFIKFYAKIKSFVLEVKTELTKVSWSTRHELMGATMVVIVVTALLAVFIGLIDLLLTGILSRMFK